MTTTTDPRITPSDEDDHECLIAAWRAEARQNLLLGFMDLARFCEERASDLEWEMAPCAD